MRRVTYARVRAGWGGCLALVGGTVGADWGCFVFIVVLLRWFSRISESTTGYIFTPCVGSLTSPDIDTR